MKKLLLCVIMIALSAITLLAQKADYTKYDVIAQTNDVSIVVKGSDYRMVVGPLRKPKTVFLLGYSKEQAAQRLQQFIEQADNKNYSKKNRPISFCGVNLRLTAIDTKAADVIYELTREDNDVRFRLSKITIDSFYDSFVVSK